MSALIILDPERLINAGASGDQTWNSAALGSGGTIFVVWQSYGLAAGSVYNSVYGRILDSHGVPMGGDILIGSSYDLGLPQISPFADGSVAVTWRGNNGGYITSKYAHFGSDGVQIGVTATAFEGFTFIAPDKAEPIILGDGRVAVVSEATSFGSDYLITGPRYYHITGPIMNVVSASGDPIIGKSGGYFNIVTPDAYDDARYKSYGRSDKSYTDSAGWADNRIVSVWVGQENVLARITTIGETRANPGPLLTLTGAAWAITDPKVTTLGSDRFVVAWQRIAGDGSTDILHQVFSTSGAALSAPQITTQVTAGHQTEPSLQALSDGHFLISWTDDSGQASPGDYRAPDLYGAAIKMREFDIGGQPVSDEIRIGTTAVGQQTSSHVTVIDRQHALVTWTDSSGTGEIGPADPSGTGIKSQVVSLFGPGLVDAGRYFAQNHDVAEARIDPREHYETYGWHEGRDPNTYFSTSGYLAAYRDVKDVGINPLQHYDLQGWKEGRDPAANFDTTLYLLRNPDVQAAGIDPLDHYLRYGQAEGRQAYAAIGLTPDATHGSFDAQYYLLSNPDVAKAAPADADVAEFAFQHYQAYGWHEGRDPDAFFDVKGYLNAYADVKAANIDPLGHYDTFGWKDGRDPSGAFDTKNYFSHNADVADAHLDPLLHYLQYGAYENRSTYADGTFFHV